MDRRCRMPALAVLMATLLTPGADAGEQAPWKATVAPPSEQGERMVVTGRVVDKATGRPIARAGICVYEADAKGIDGDNFEDDPLITVVV